MMGGRDGEPHRYYLRPPGKRPKLLGSKVEGVPVAAGSRFDVRSAGGGGWGDSNARDDAAIRQDHKNGFTTRKRVKGVR